MTDASAPRRLTSRDDGRQHPPARPPNGRADGQRHPRRRPAVPRRALLGDDQRPPNLFEDLDRQHVTQQPRREQRVTQ